MDGSLILLTAFIVLGSLILVAFGFAWARPRQFLAAHRLLPPFVVIIAYLLAFFVISTPIMFGLIEFLEPLPYDWGSVDEDGDFVPLRESIASIVSFALGVWILSVTYGWVSERVAAEDLLDEVRLTHAMLEEPHYLDGIIKRWEKELEWADRGSDQFPRRSRLLATARKWQEHIERQKESAAFYATERQKTPPPQPPPVRWSAEAMKRSRHNLQLATTATLADLEDYRLLESDRERVSALFRAMRELTQEHTPKMGEARNGESIDLTTMLGRLPGTSVVEGASVVATYRGDPDDGHTEISAKRSGSEVGILSALRFTESLEGAASAFFVAHELETFGAYSHGLYGRDHRVLLTWNELAGFVTDYFWKAPDDERLSQLSVPPGLLVERDGEAIIVSALTGLTTGSLERRQVRFVLGEVQVLPSIAVIEGNTRTYY